MILGVACFVVDFPISLCVPLFPITDQSLPTTRVGEALIRPVHTDAPNVRFWKTAPE